MSKKFILFNVIRPLKIIRIFNLSSPSLQQRAKVVMKIFLMTLISKQKRWGKYFFYVLWRILYTTQLVRMCSRNFHICVWLFISHNMYAAVKFLCINTHFCEEKLFLFFSLTRSIALILIVEVNCACFSVAFYRFHNKTTFFLSSRACFLFFAVAV